MKIIKNLLTALTLLIIFSGNTSAFFGAKTKCLFTFHVNTKSMRGGYVKSNRTILYRSVRYMGRRGFSSRRFSRYYMIRFQFYRPVKPIAAKTDGGSAYIQIDRKKSYKVPAADKDFTSHVKGKIIDVYTADKPTYVKLIVEGKGWKKNRTKKNKFKKYRKRRFPMSGTSVAHQFRIAFKEKSLKDIRAYFGKRRIFYKEYTNRKRNFSHISSGQALLLLAKDIQTARRLQVKSGYSKVTLQFVFSNNSITTWIVEKGFSTWQITKCRKNNFNFKNRYRRYFRR